MNPLLQALLQRQFYQQNQQQNNPIQTIFSGEARPIIGPPQPAQILPGEPNDPVTKSIPVDIDKWVNDLPQPAQYPPSSPPPVQYVNPNYDPSNRAPRVGTSNSFSWSAWNRQRPQPYTSRPTPPGRLPPTQYPDPTSRPPITQGPQPVQYQDPSRLPTTKGPQPAQYPDSSKSDNKGAY